ncbi:MAG: helix-turn-helix domain-containing protein [Phycisphaerales bacterium]
MTCMTVEAVLVDELTMARMLSISRRKLFDLRKAGKVPAVQFDTCVRYDPRDVLAAIKSKLPAVVAG